MLDRFRNQIKKAAKRKRRPLTATEVSSLSNALGNLTQESFSAALMRFARRLVTPKEIKGRTSSILLRRPARARAGTHLEAKCAAASIYRYPGLFVVYPCRGRPATPFGGRRRSQTRKTRSHSTQLLACGLAAVSRIGQRIGANMKSGAQFRKDSGHHRLGLITTPSTFRCDLSIGTTVAFSWPVWRSSGSRRVVSVRDGRHSPCSAGLRSAHTPSAPRRAAGESTRWKLAYPSPRRRQRGRNARQSPRAR